MVTIKVGVERVSSEALPGRVLDVNRFLLPATEETDDGGAVSSPNSAMSSFKIDFFMMNGNGARNRRKRKHERDGADRTSDDEENGSTRKKLGLSKEQSAFHEESFKEHTTLNPEMKRAAEGDVESGGGETKRLPTMLENLQLRWFFIRKVYSIITVQLLLTIAAAFVVVFIRLIAFFFVSSVQGFVLYIVLIFVPIIRLCPHKYYSLFFIFTVILAFANGFSCAFESRKVILEAVTLTTVMVSSLTLYTFWAARRGHDFNFLCPFLSEALAVISLFVLIQTLFPLGQLSVMIYGCLASIIYSGYIRYDTDNIIKRLSYDEHIWASFSLYLDIISLFSSLFTLFIRHRYMTPEYVYGGSHLRSCCCNL